MQKIILGIAILCMALISIAPEFSRAAQAPSEQLARQNTFGAHRETVEDLRVKVLGGFIRHTRSWNNGQWYFNRRWEALQLELKDSTSTDDRDVIIHRSAAQYEYKSSGIWAHETEPGQTITRVTDGYRWQNRRGDWINYDTNRRAVNYGDRNNVTVSFQYDAQDRLTGVFDHLNNQILWFSYDLENNLSQVRDYSNRQVEYNYLNGQLDKVIDVRGNTSTYTYQNDRMVSKTDAEGRETIISYTPMGLVSGINTAGVSVQVSTDYNKTTGEFYRREVYSTGKVIEKWYNRAGEFIRKSINGVNTRNLEINGLSRINTDQAGNRTTYTYDQWDNLISTTYPDGSNTSTVYEHTFTRPVKEVNENGVITLKEYDDRGNLTKLTEAAGLPEQRITSFTYDAYGNQLTKTIHADAVSVEVTTSATYDEFGNKLTTTDGEGHTAEYTYDVLGNVLTRTDPLKHVWAYTYDEAGNQLSDTNPLNHATTYGYDKVGNLTSVTDALQRVTRYEYDTRNNRVAEINALNEKTVFRYNGEDNLIQTTDAGGRSSFITYNLDSQVEKIIDGNGNVIQYEYINDQTNGSGKIGKTTYPSYHETYNYDNRGREIVWKRHLTEDHFITDLYGYDLVGNRITVIEEGGRLTRYVYDAYNRLIEVIDPLNSSTKYSYDNRGNLLSVTNANTGITQYAYNRNNEKTSETKPLGQQTHFGYNAVGQKVWEIDANNQKRVLVYDAAGRNVAIESYRQPTDENPVKTVSYEFNNVGELIGYNDGITSGSYQLDELYRVTNVSVNYGVFTKGYAYTYDLSGNKDTFTRPDGAAISYVYDSNNHIAAINVPEVGQVNYSDYFWMLPRKVTLPGGSSQNYTYDSLMSIVEIALKDPAANNIMSYTYVFDEAGNVAKKQTEHGDYIYGYDELSRLINVDNPTQIDAVYSYDPLGNRLADNHVSGSWEYNLNNQLTSIGADASYVYDAHGSLTGTASFDQSREYTYNIDNRLTEVKENSATLANYNYDPFGRRISKEIAGVITYYLYSEEGLVAELDQNGVVIKQYGWKPNSTWGTSPVYLQDSTDIYFYQNDHLGTPQKLFTRSGSVAWSATYESFGDAIIQTEIVENNLRFPGQYYDKETGLHQNYFRDYDPALGRYVQSDPLGLDAGVNTYNYVLANPINLIDPTGLNSCGAEGGRRYPNEFSGRSIEKACSDHDKCYGDCNKSKSECDKQFYKDIRRSCAKKVRPRGGSAIACNIASIAYYAAVAAGGKDAYKKAQEKCGPCK